MEDKVKIDFDSIVILYPGKTNYHMVSHPANYSLPRLLLLLEEISDVPIYFFNTEKKVSFSNNIHFKHFNYFQILLLLFKLRKKRVVLISQSIKHDRFAVMLKRIFSVKVMIRRGGIYHGRSQMESTEFKSSLKKFRYLRKADAVHSTLDGTPVNMYFDLLGIDLSKRHGQLNGFPIVKSQHSKRQNKAICISRLSPEKAVDLAIHAFALADKKLHENYELDIVGDGPERGKLEELCKLLNIEAKVNFLGHKDDAISLIGQSKLFINPLGNNTVIESIAARTPVISLELGELEMNYSTFPNVFIIPYEKGGYGPIPAVLKDSLKIKMSEKIVEVLNNFSSINLEYTIDYSKYGWETRLENEIKIYNELFE